jgi:hypothetical protein
VGKTGMLGKTGMQNWLVATVAGNFLAIEWWTNREIDSVEETIEKDRKQWCHIKRPLRSECIIQIFINRRKLSFVGYRYFGHFWLGGDSGRRAEKNDSDRG